MIKVKKNKQNTQKKVAVESSTMLFRKFLIAVVILYTAVLFYPVFNHEFTNWDDLQYITQNELIRDLSFDGIIKIFSTPVIGMFNPLPFLVYAIGFKLWGINPEMFHMINLLFHLIGCYVIYRFILSLTQRFETALIVTVLFAIHPMHVGVVAWASQTKTSMYTIFYLIGLIQYIRYIREDNKIKYLYYAGIFFILSLLSKPTAVSFAPMLFVIDYYFSRKIDKKLILEKIPFFMLSLLFGIITIFTHKAAGDNIFEVEHHYSFINSILVANYSLTFYLEKLFLPINLSSIYPYPENSAFLPLKYYLCLLIIPLIIFIIYRAGKLKKDIVFGVLFFIITISMVLRIIPTGHYAFANRYSYLSYTGLFFIIAQAGLYWYDNRKSYPLVFQRYWIFLVVCLVMLSSWRTVRRVKVWKDSITLFDDVIKKHPKFAIAYFQRGYSKADNGQFHDAIDDMSKAIELKPNYVDAYLNRGIFRYEIKDYDGALSDYNKVITLDPGNTTVYSNKGNLLIALKKFDLALNDLNKAVLLDPNYNLAYFNRGIVKINLSDTSGALADWKQASALGFEKANEYIGYYSQFFNPNK